MLNCPGRNAAGAPSDGSSVSVKVSFVSFVTCRTIQGAGSIGSIGVINAARTHPTTESESLPIAGLLPGRTVSATRSPDRDFPRIAPAGICHRVRSPEPAPLRGHETATGKEAPTKTSPVHL